MKVPGNQKNLYKRICRSFLDREGSAERTFREQLLEVLGEVCADPWYRQDPEPPRILYLDELVAVASKRSSQRNPDRPLDQVKARRAYFDLFKELKDEYLGLLWKGRRGGRTRVQLPWGAEAESGRVALTAALAELDIRTPEWVFEKESKEIDQNLRRREGEEKSLAAAGAHSLPVSSEPATRPRREDVLARLKAHDSEIRGFGVSALSLFGSIARDEARPESDVDLLARFDSGVTSDKYCGAKFFLEDLLGRRVDLVTEDVLRARLRENVERELIRVA
jgi:predicted nucleotidyltransferase